MAWHGGRRAGGPSEAVHENRGRRMRECHSTMNLVLDDGRSSGLQVYLGGHLCASNQALLLQYNIKNVVNCTHDGCNLKAEPFHFKAPFRWLRFPITQAPLEKENIFGFFQPLFDFVRRSAARKTAVLIHCRAGAHRAATTAAAVYMAFHKVAPAAAQHDMKRLRREVNINGELLRTLERLYAYFQEAGYEEVRVIPSIGRWKQVAPAAESAVEAPQLEEETAEVSSEASVSAEVAAAEEASGAAAAAAPEPPQRRPMRRAAELAGQAAQRAARHATRAQRAFAAAAAEEEATAAAAAAAAAVPQEEAAATAFTAAEVKAEATVEEEMEEEEEVVVPAALVAAPAAEPPSSSESENETGLPKEKWNTEAGRIVICSWNAGKGAHNLIPLMARSGYHIVCLQEASEEQRAAWPLSGWSCCVHAEQFFACRSPMTAEALLHEGPAKACRYCLSSIAFGRGRASLHQLNILSIHLCNVVAKKKVAAPAALEEVFDACAGEQVDLITGDLNCFRALQLKC